MTDGARRLGPVIPWLVVYALLAIATMLGIGTVRQTLGLYGLAELANPYFVPANFWLLYVLTPLASLATALFLLAPGLMLAAGLGGRKGLALWLLTGFGWNVVVLTAAITLFQLTTGIVPTGFLFWKLVGAVGLVCLAVLAWCQKAGRGLRVDFADRGDLAASALVFLGCLILLSPKFYWENFTGDGSGALQFARLFIHTLWPFWMPQAGIIGQAPGLSMVLFVAPESWFVRLWGETEFAVRVPYLLYLAIVYPALAALIRWQRQVRLSLTDSGLIVAILFLYSLTIIYSGGYNPYFGDSPMPAARETLAIALFLGFVLAFAEGRFAPMLVIGFLVSITIPTGGLWLGLVALGALLVWRPTDRARVIAAFWVVGIAVAVSVLLPRLIPLAGLPYPVDGEFGLKGIVNRLRYVVVSDWQRFAFLMVPGAILPALFLATWKQQDRLARLVTAVTVLFFLFFYIQGYRVLLHHFAPVMLAPLVVFWRSPMLAGPATGAIKAGLAVAIAASVWIAWPKEMKMHTFDRAIGATIETLGPRFESAAPDSRPETGERFRGFSPQAIDTAHVLLGKLFPIGYGNDEAKQRFFGAPLVWWYYSEFPKPAGQAINYRLKPLADATEADGALFAEHDGYGLFITDPALYDQHRTTQLPTDTGAAIFAIRRERMFPTAPSDGGVRVFDLVAIARSLLGK